MEEEPWVDIPKVDTTNFSCGKVNTVLRLKIETNDYFCSNPTLLGSMLAPRVPVEEIGTESH